MPVLTPNFRDQLPVRLEYYALGIGLLAFYGSAVCPLIQTLGFVEIAWVLGVGLFFGTFFVAGVMRSVEEIPPVGYFLAGFTTWALAGLIFTAYNLFFFHFGVVQSGLKMVVGCLAMGLVSGVDRALSGMRTKIIEGEGKVSKLFEKGRFFSVSTMFFLFYAASMLALSGMSLLMVNKDLLEIRKAILDRRAIPFDETIHEVLFVTLALVVFSLFLARSFGANLQLLFESILDAMARVESGDLKARVPVVTRDEFGEIAAGTNSMIEGLEDRARVRQIFGKYVSPTVAQSILDSKEELALGGREVEVAILFIDLRDFTPLSEALGPRRLVEYLNRYFQVVVDATQSAGGFIDKFIGDAAMGVFGVEDSALARPQSMQAAESILQGVEALNQELLAEKLPPVSIGIGIHFGTVVAGNVGCKDRLEFTVIGDPVNVAARLESATKAAQARLLVSAEVAEGLDPEVRARLGDYGELTLKGKSHGVQAFGLP